MSVYTLHSDSPSERWSFSWANFEIQLSMPFVLIYDFACSFCLFAHLPVGFQSAFGFLTTIPVCPICTFAPLIPGFDFNLFFFTSLLLFILAWLNLWLPGFLTSAWINNVLCLLTDLHLVSYAECNTLGIVLPYPSLGTLTIWANHPTDADLIHPYLITLTFIIILNESGLPSLKYMIHRKKHKHNFGKRKKRY